MTSKDKDCSYLDILLHEYSALIVSKGTYQGCVLLHEVRDFWGHEVETMFSNSDSYQITFQAVFY